MVDAIHLVLTPVREDRAAEFERFLAEVVAPAVSAQRPDLARRWRVLRADGTVAGVVTFAFLLHGGSLTEDWELDTVLPAHYGRDEADRLVSEWADTFAELAPWADAAVGAGRDANQLAWSLRPVDVTGPTADPDATPPVG